ncbi:TIGR04255 family protein [Paenibacillus sp. 7124]|uniref:TIGR04255 family protein n=1 Tax=Paenibacillus apii TaxID=1850370 RepID=A0A6M1PEE3_9BACL|nr:TIGR04255 family protein [Paenibacillus apii]NGM81720.1 TIGR04255 family protein [Paenibacillus apii]
MPQGLSDFFTQLVIPSTDGKCMAIITETIDNSRRTEHILPLLFDINVIKEVVFSAKEDFWLLFDEMHDYKNQIFFNSITDKGRELFR